MRGGEEKRREEKIREEREKKNGELLMDFTENELEILNLTRGGRKATWRGNDENISYIDYVLANDRARRKITDLWIDEGEVEMKSRTNGGRASTYAEEKVKED